MVGHFDMEETKMTTSNQERSAGRTGPPKFPLGEVLVTPNLIAALIREDVVHALCRHMRGDWGDVGDEVGRANDAALADSSPVFSSYRAGDGTRFWVVTTKSRAFTVVLLPEDCTFTPRAASAARPEFIRIGAGWW
jgi:hypothetical protein